MARFAGSLGARPRDGRDGFTIVEILVVMVIILVLVGLVLGTSGYVQNKAARSANQEVLGARRIRAKASADSTPSPCRYK